MWCGRGTTVLTRGAAYGLACAGGEPVRTHVITEAERKRYNVLLGQIRSSDAAKRIPALKTLHEMSRNRTSPSPNVRHARLTSMNDNCAL